MHTVTVYLDDSCDLPTWAHRVLEAFPGLKTFQIRQLHTDYMDAEREEKMNKAVQDGSFIFDMPGSFHLTMEGSTWTWTWTGSLGRSFYETGEESPCQRAINMLRKENRSTLGNYTGLSVLLLAIHKRWDIFDIGLLKAS